MCASPNHRGFTLLEVLVVILIVGMLATLTVAGINAVTGRQLQSHGDQLLLWIQSIEENAQLSGNVHGIALRENKLLPVALLEDNWYQVADLESWQIPEEIILSLPQQEDDIALNPHDDNNFQPFVILTETGLIYPHSSLTLTFANDVLVLYWGSGGWQWQ